MSFFFPALFSLRQSLSSNGIGMLYASSTKSPQFRTSNPLVSLCPALSKSHKMATTLGSALHLQYHALTLEHASSTAGMIVMINVDYLIEPDKTKLDFLRHF